ncbi:MAG TPA: type II secretion system F family protein [Actinomycetota bacterium]|jgi:tight adherence protein B|nr:type II secretion system F family protein [Actinomycetota bacterium]
MSRRITRTGILLLTGLLLGTLAFGGVATGQENNRLRVEFGESDPSPGKLGLTIGMSGPAWDPSLQLTKDAFSARINGSPVKVTGAVPVGVQQGGTRAQLAVILAVDTSGSMRKNDNIAKARSAAARFAAGMPPGTRLGVLSFGTQTKLVQELTTDRTRVQAVIQNLQAEDSGGTALYDAVVKGSQLLAGESGQANLVVLSDGKHEGTATTLQEAIKAAKDKAKVTAVALDAGFEQDKAALQDLAVETGGKTQSASEDSLELVFQSVAEALASQYVVDMVLPPGLGKKVELRLEVRANGEVGVLDKPDFLLPPGVSPTATGPATPVGPIAAPGLSRLESPQGMYVLALAGFTAVLIAGLLLFGSMSGGTKPYRVLRQRLSPYSLTPAISDDKSRVTAFGSSEWAGRATAMAETLVRRGNLEEAFLDRLEAAGLNMRVAEFVLISLGSSFIPPLLVLIATRNLVLTVVVVLLGVVGPFLYLSVRAARRQAKFEEQLPSTLQLLSGALQAGHSLQQAVDTVVHEAGDPIASEFQRVLTEARLGRPLEEALEAMAKRTRSVDFDWTVMAIRLQRQVGGNLAEVLSTVAQTIRDRYTLKRQIKALSAEGRLSSIILSVLPVLLFAGLLILNPLFLRPLFTTTMGLMMMGGSVVLMIFGVFWLKKITEIKV